MSKTQLYWTLQLLGWTIFIMYDFVFYSAEYGFDTSYFLLSIANIFLAVTLTHLYRLVIRRWNWSSLPMLRLVFRVGFSVLILATIMTFVNLPIDRQLLAQNIVDHPFVFWNYFSSWSKTLLAWVLSYTVYHYVEQTRMTELEKIMLKTSMREAEAKVLRSQLNPHFTFNALNSIRALVMEDPLKAQHSITQLSNILRNSLLADRRKTVDLREELKTVEDYLELEKVRYEERLSYTIKADPQTLYWQVPPMMLQTLVENGIKHGVSRLPKGGYLEVESILEGNFLIIQIRNTGTLGSTDSGGVGLLNTAERLSILYGKDAHFKIFQEEENWVCAEVKIPMISDGLHRFSGETPVARDAN
ncbi:sensor histidine kinase [Arundinibacter roseus]|uniref:Sensor histidine kinase n=1 Tax=Arundinibacter roseus TaxID=2070510 RepID=A0A4R4KA20_9BACT|nr:histidine kinase [Arundinibacter roseus]TDB64648.1 sensor histidine kinase [Arundinibacter roseus]